MSTKKKKLLPVSEKGIVHIRATFNNIIVSVTNKAGDTIGWSSAGKIGFRGAKKTTPLAAQLATKECVGAAYERGLREVEIRIKGIGPGREAAARAVGEIGVRASEIKDITPIPHGGCRPPKARKN